MTTPGAPRGSRRLRLILIAIVVIAIAVVAGTIWYFFFRPAGPPPVGPGAPVIPGLLLLG